MAGRWSNFPFFVTGAFFVGTVMELFSSLSFASRLGACRERPLESLRAVGDLAQLDSRSRKMV